MTVFPQRTDGQHDYRIWNSQLISYAGYRLPDGTVLGDPMHIEFTEVSIDNTRVPYVNIIKHENNIPLELNGD